MGDKTVVVTGASGFLGSHLVQRLRDEEGYRVLALSARSRELQRRMGGANVICLPRDAFAADSGLWAGAVVVNCAYPRNATGPAVADGLKYVQKVFEGAVAGRAAAILNVSSQSVYSQQRTEAAAEDAPVCLESPYAVGKFATELMLESVCRGGGTEFTNVRLASLIGPGFDQRIVNRLLVQAVEQRRMVIHSSERRFAFLDVEDAVDGILSLIQTPVERWRPCYNLGGQESYTLDEIAETIQSCVRDRLGELTIERDTVVERGSGALDAARLRADTGFVSRVPLNESVARIFESVLARRETGAREDMGNG